MQKYTRFVGLLSVLAISILPTVASAYVTAMPASYDFGDVPAGRSAGTMIVFMNNSNQPVRYFNVNCSGDTSEFTCFSNCFFLQPYGSCSVQVQFNARNGDNLRKMVWLNGSGDGQFATSTVYATDKKLPQP